MLDRREAPVEFVEFDRAHHRREHRRQLGRLAGGDQAARDQP
jgi:hypothetical protein